MWLFHLGACRAPTHELTLQRSNACLSFFRRLPTVAPFDVRHRTSSRHIPLRLAHSLVPAEPTFRHEDNQPRPALIPCKRCKSGKTRETVSCGDDVFGKVRLIEGLNCSDFAGEAAITVKEGATLDCQGNTIFGRLGYVTGIWVQEGGTVKNCKIVGFPYGIYSTGPSTITNCVISDSEVGLDYFPNTSSPKDKYEAKNIFITNSERSISFNLDGKTNRFKFDSVTIANPTDTPGIFVGGNMGGSSLTFNKITSFAEASFSKLWGSGTIKIKSSIFDGGGVEYTEKSKTTNNIKLSIEKTLIINAPQERNGRKNLGGIDYQPDSTSSSTLDVSDSSVVLSGGDGVYVNPGTATLDSVELSGNSRGGLTARDSDVTAKNILVQLNGYRGISILGSASVNVNDSKVCQNKVDDIGGSGPGPALNNVVCERVNDFVSGVTCPSSPVNCTADEEVATTSCV